MYDARETPVWIDLAAIDCGWIPSPKDHQRIEDALSAVLIIHPEPIYSLVFLV